MKVIEFKDLDYTDEFILDPQTQPEEAPVIVYMKYGAGADDCGLTPDTYGSVKEIFPPHQKVIRVFATTAYKLKNKHSRRMI